TSPTADSHSHHFRTFLTTCSFPSNSLKVGQPVTSVLPAANFFAVSHTAARCFSMVSLSVTVTMVRMKSTVSSSVHPPRSKPPARARTQSWRDPSGQYRTSKDAAASRLTFRFNTPASTTAGSPSSSKRIGSPVGCTLGGNTVCTPVPRNSTSINLSFLVLSEGATHFSDSIAGFTTYSQCERGALLRPKTHAVSGRKYLASARASGQSRSMSVSPWEASP